MSNAESLELMFSHSVAFNQPLYNWNTSNVKNFYGTFQWATSFNQNISRWSIHSGNNFERMILGVQQLKEQVKHWKNKNKNVHLTLWKNFILKKIIANLKNF